MYGLIIWGSFDGFNFWLYLVNFYVHLSICYVLILPVLFGNVIRHCYQAKCMFQFSPYYFYLLCCVQCSYIINIYWTVYKCWFTSILFVIIFSMNIIGLYWLLDFPWSHINLFSHVLLMYCLTWPSDWHSVFHTEFVTCLCCGYKWINHCLVSIYTFFVGFHSLHACTW